MKDSEKTQKHHFQRAGVLKKDVNQVKRTDLAGSREKYVGRLEMLDKEDSPDSGDSIGEG